MYMYKLCTTAYCKLLIIYKAECQRAEKDLCMARYDGKKLVCDNEKQTKDKCDL